MESDIWPRQTKFGGRMEEEGSVSKDIQKQFDACEIELEKLDESGNCDLFFVCFFFVVRAIFFCSLALSASL